MVLEIPELAQADTGNVDDVGGIGDWHFWSRSFERRDKRKDEVQQVVVECKEREQLRGRRKVFVVR